jgi:septal ring factor EnvC (AmiA/AmiB activator)
MPMEFLEMTIGEMCFDIAEENGGLERKIKAQEKRKEDLLAKIAAREREISELQAQRAKVAAAATSREFIAASCLGS